MGIQNTAIGRRTAHTVATRVAAGRYAHIDALRAFAVLLVVCQHSGLTFIPGPSGVTLFFVISGFVITHILIKERVRSGRFDAGAFYAKRVLKLAPPFLAAIVIPTLLIGTVIQAFKLDLVLFLSQIFFAYNWVQVAVGGEPGGLLPGSQVVWSLAVEEQFYIAFALIWVVLVRSRRWLLGLVTLAAAAIVGATVLRLWLALDGAGEFRIARATDTRIDAIAAGILGAVALHLWQTGRLGWLGRLGGDWALILAGVAFVAGFAPLGSWWELTVRYSLHALTALLVILYGLLPGGRLKAPFQSASAWRPVNLIGLASYSIYLVHHVLGGLLEPAVAGLPRFAEAGVLIGAGVAAGIALYYLVEIPSLKLKGRLDF